MFLKHKVQQCSRTTEMIYCVYLKLFEWMNNMMFIVGYLDIYMNICLALIFSLTFPRMDYFPNTPTAPTPAKTKKTKKQRWPLRTVPLGHLSKPWAIGRSPGTESMPTMHDFEMAYVRSSSYSPPLFAGKRELVRRRFLWNIWDLLKSCSD